ncbi:hypothetical protein CRUP_013981 [Coryphaenoides rupestris]|nr:hypothetical protein CRUP_013981 [Coryphaenoides rupestris]
MMMSWISSQADKTHCSSGILSTALRDCQSSAEVVELLRKDLLALLELVQNIGSLRDGKENSQQVKDHQYSPHCFGFSGPGSAHPEVRGDALVFSSGSTSQGDSGGTWPSTLSRQNRDPNSEGGVYSKGDSYSDAGDSGWVTNGGVDTGTDSYYPAPSGGDGMFDELLPSTDEDQEEEEEEEPVLSNVSDLEPVYHFNSRSKYQRRRKLFRLSGYKPGEDLSQPADMLGSNSSGKSVVSRQPVKSGYF